MAAATPERSGGGRRRCGRRRHAGVTVVGADHAARRPRAARGPRGRSPRGRQSPLRACTTSDVAGPMARLRPSSSFMDSAPRLRTGRRNSAPFGERYRLLLVDLPGHWRSALPRERLTIEAMAERVDALLDQLDTPPAHVVGLSLGGSVGLELALRAPARVRSLTLVNAFARLGPPDAAGGLRMLARLVLLGVAAHVGRGGVRGARALPGAPAGPPLPSRGGEPRSNVTVDLSRLDRGARRLRCARPSRSGRLSDARRRGRAGPHGLAREHGGARARHPRRARGARARLGPRDQPRPADDLQPHRPRLPRSPLRGHPPVDDLSLTPASLISESRRTPAIQSPPCGSPWRWRRPCSRCSATPP